MNRTDGQRKRPQAPPAPPQGPTPPAPEHSEGDDFHTLLDWLRKMHAVLMATEQRGSLFEACPRTFQRGPRSVAAHRLLVATFDAMAEMLEDSQPPDVMDEHGPFRVHSQLIDQTEPEVSNKDEGRMLAEWRACLWLGRFSAAIKLVMPVCVRPPSAEDE